MLAASGRYVMRLLCLLTAVNQLIIVSAQTAPSPGCVAMELGFTIPTPSNEQDWTYVKQFVTSIIRQLDIGRQDHQIQVGVATYRGDSQAQFDLDDYQTKDALISAIEALPMISASGNNISGAMRTLRQEVLSFGWRGYDNYIQKVAMTFTDERARDSEALTRAYQEFNDNGIVSLAVGLTRGSYENDLSKMTDNSEDYIRLAGSYSDLESRVDDVVELLCAVRRKVCAKQAEIGVILDHSTSIVAEDRGGYDNWEVSVRAFLLQLIDAFPIGPTLTRMGMVGFSNNAWLYFGFDAHNNPRTMRQAVIDWEIQGGETNIAQGFRVARNELFAHARSNITKIAILVTDGRANRDPLATIPEANKTKAEGVEVFTIGITDDVDEDQLRDIASPDTNVSRQHYFYVENFEDLQTIIAVLVNSSCIIVPTTPPPPTTTTTTTTTTPSTTTSISTSTSTTTTPTTTTTTTTTPSTTTSTTTTSTTTTTTPTTTTSTTTTSTTTTPTTTSTTTTTTTTPAPTTPLSGPCLSDAELMFVMATGAEMDPYYMPRLVEFITNLTLSLPVDSGQVRIGVMTYGLQPLIDIALGQLTRSTDIIAALANLTYHGTSTNTAAALTLLRTHAFTSARVGVSRIALFVSNANSEDALGTQHEADLTRRAGVSIMAVAVGSWLDINELRSVVSYPAHRNMLQVSSYDTLGAVAPTIHDAVCGNINMCFPDPCLNDGQCLPILNYYICICRPGYGGQRCDNPCLFAGDIVFTIDSSGSIGLLNFIQVTSFVTKLAHALDLDDALISRGDGLGGFRVGLLTFSTGVSVVFQLNTYTDKALLLKALDVRYMDGTTNTADAIRLSTGMLTPGNGSRQGVPDILLIITDGQSDHPPQTWIEAIEARRQGISVIAIGIGPNANYSELRSMASAPESSNVIVSKDFSSLTDDLVFQISSLVCRNNDTCIDHQCVNGATCKQIIGGYTCGPCPEGFAGLYCQRGCTSYIDLVFVVDVSGSIQSERMKHVREFLVEIVADIDVGPNSTRVGAAYFSDDAYTAFTLDQYSTRQDVQEAIRNIPYIGGKTNIAAGLRMTRTDLLEASNGARSAARDVVIVISDGDANVAADETIPEGVLLKNERQAVVKAVAVGQPSFINFNVLRSVVSRPTESHIFNTTSFYLLTNMTERVINATCNDVDECSPNPCLNGAECVDDYERYVCICSSQNTGYQCERTCTRQMDVVIILDLSGSIEEVQRYDAMVDLARAIAVGLPVASGRARVGAVTYESTAKNEFYLSTYDRDVQGLLNAFEFNHVGGTTNTQAALSLASSAQFTSSNGDRLGADNIAIVISDGFSDVQEGDTVAATAAASLKAAGVTVYTVAVTDSSNLVELNNINSDPDPEYLFTIGDSGDYMTTADELLDQLCQ